MTPKRPSAVSTDLATLVPAAVGAQLVRAAWAVYGDQILATARPAARSLADGARTAAGQAAHRLADEARTIAADAAVDLAGKARAAVGKAAQNFALDLCDAAGQAFREAVTTGRVGAVR